VTRQGNLPLCPACLGKDPAAPFHKRLRTLRLTRGLTQAELAQRAGLSTGTVAALERGAWPPLPQGAAQLAGALGVEAGEL
jgi:transcriptional regulator with XRE-family HTH domain